MPPAASPQLPHRSAVDGSSWRSYVSIIQSPPPISLSVDFHSTGPPSSPTATHCIDKYGNYPITPTSSAAPRISLYGSGSHPFGHPSPLKREYALDVGRRATLSQDRLYNICGPRWAIGDGRAVAVLEDPWMDSLPLCLWPTFISMDVGPELRVADLLRPDGAGWDLPSISLLFGGPLVERVLMVAVPGGGGPDVRLWGPSCSSHVRLRDLDSLFRADVRLPVDSGWVWRFGLHPRVALFLWKVAWGRLPTCELLCRRGLNIPASCSVCGVEESLVHVLLHCPRAARVWELAGAPVAALQSSESLVQIIRTWAASESSRLVAMQFTCLAYQIWGARNSRIFQGSILSSRLVLERAWALADEMARAVHFSRPLIARRTWGSSSAAAAPRMIFFTWEPPPPSFLKVNFDGSVSDRGLRAGAGFVIRDPASRLIAVGGCQITDISVPGAELRAAWAGLRFARCRLGASTIVLEGDSATVIGWIRDRAERGFRIHPLLGDIWRMADGCVTFEARHIYREGNGAADWTASYAAYHQGDVLWEGMGFLPQALRDILLSDSTGCIYSRVLY